MVGDGGADTQSTQSRGSCRPPQVPASCSADTGRTTNDFTLATGAPSSSATSRDTPPDSPRARRTRSEDAPSAESSTPAQENGSRIWPASTPVSSPNSPTGCSAASSSAGCNPNPAAPKRSSSGRETSANTSSPHRQAAVRHLKAGPYSRPHSAKRSYTSSTSTRCAARGGHTPPSRSSSSVDAASPASVSAEERTPVACRTQDRSASSRPSSSPSPSAQE